VAWEFEVHEVGSVAFIFGGVAHGGGVLSNALALSRCGCCLIRERVSGLLSPRAFEMSLMVARCSTYRTVTIRVLEVRTLLGLLCGHDRTTTFPCISPAECNPQRGHDCMKL
jgi:hypothetical protein